MTTSLPHQHPEDIAHISQDFPTSIPHSISKSIGVHIEVVVEVSYYAHPQDAEDSDAQSGVADFDDTTKGPRGEFGM